MPGTTEPGSHVGAEGLIVIRQDDPVRSARALAKELGVPVAIGGIGAERAVASWPSLRSGPRPASLDELDRLGERTLRAEAVVARTRARVADELERSLQTALAIHPETLRRAADGYLEALEEWDRPMEQEPPRTAAMLAGIFLGVVAVVTGFAIKMPIVGYAVGGVVFLLGFGIWVADLLRRPETVADVEARVALAQRRWEDVAGLGADPTDIDAVVRRHDPQAGVIEDLVGYSPAVRAAEQALVDHRVAWVRRWRETLDNDGTGAATPPDHSTVQRIRDLLLGQELAAVVIADAYGGLSDDRASKVYDELVNVPKHVRAIVMLGPVPERVGGVPAGQRSSTIPSRDGAVVDLAGAEAIAPGAPGTSVSEPLDLPKASENG